MTELENLELDTKGLLVDEELKPCDGPVLVVHPNPPIARNELGLVSTNC